MKQETKIFIPFYGLPFCFQPFETEKYKHYVAATIMQALYYGGTVFGLTALLS